MTSVYFHYILGHLIIFFCELAANDSVIQKEFRDVTNDIFGL